MKRYLTFSALSLLLVGSASTWAQDRVERHEKGDKVSTVSGKITKEDVSGIVIKPQSPPNAKEVTIPANEISRVNYGDVPAKVSLEIAKLADAEGRRDYAALLKGYEAVMSLPEVRSLAPASRRNLEFRTLSLRVLNADDEKSTKAAIDSLQGFVGTNGDAWEYAPAASLLGRLQANSGDFAGATRTLEALEKKSGVPVDFRSEATSALLDIAFQSGNFDAGKKRLEAVAKDPKATPALKERVALYQLGLDGAQAKDPKALESIAKKIEAAIATAKNPSIRALGYNLLGDCYAAQKQDREAMWSYLWVDVVFNQDRGEHVKAMNRLLKIFEESKDAEKVKLYKDKLAQAR
jgi:hypothetical protein